MGCFLDPPRELVKGKQVLCVKSTWHSDLLKPSGRPQYPKKFDFSPSFSVGHL